jgi:hypothetical protein
MGSHEETNVDFWNLCHGEAYNLSTSLEHAARVRQVLAENNRSITMQALRPGIIGQQTLPIDIDFLYRVEPPPNKYDELTPYRTPLMVAVDSNNLALAHVLVEYGGDVNHAGSERFSGSCKTTPLQWALWQAQDYGAFTNLIYDNDIIRLLLVHGASTTFIEESNGATCLHMTANPLRGKSYMGRAHHDLSDRPAFKAREDRMQLLLEYIPPAALQHLLSIRDKSCGLTPLMLAINTAVFSQPDHHATALMLIAAGDRVCSNGLLEIKCRRGLTAMGHCIDCIGDRVFHAGPVILRALLLHGAKTETRIGEYKRWFFEESDVSMTALHKACLKSGNHWAIEILLDAGADRDARDAYGLTPEMYAVKYGLHEATAIFEAYDIIKKCEAFASSHHKRLGEGSSAVELSPDTMRGILSKVLGYKDHTT